MLVGLSLIVLEILILAYKPSVVTEMNVKGTPEGNDKVK
jgi:hypothetical protein